jgi:hypothetical protein
MTPAANPKHVTGGQKQYASCRSASRMVGPAGPPGGADRWGGTAAAGSAARAARRPQRPRTLSHPWRMLGP